MNPKKKSPAAQFPTTDELLEALGRIDSAAETAGLECQLTEREHTEIVNRISAAPDLLQAAKDIVNYFSEWERDYPDDKGRFDKARAAIRKAEGGK